MEKILRKWLGFQFSSGSVTGEDYKLFEKELLNLLKRNLRKEGIEFVNPVRGHYYCSCIVKNTNTGKFAYFSISDVRFSQDEWAYKVLYRDCAHEKDWSGGSNRYCTIEDLINNIIKITQ